MDAPFSFECLLSAKCLTMPCNESQYRFLSIIFALILVPCLAQKKTDSELKSEEAKTFNVKDYEEWQRISIDEFSFLPKDFKVEKRGIDLEYWRYKTDSVDLAIYSGSRLPKHSCSIKQLSTFNEKSLYINNILLTLRLMNMKGNITLINIWTLLIYIDKQTIENGMIIYFVAHIH